jgi:glucosamine--fructose-6-phosphate aminotransferase (isomerizing)
MPSTSQSSLDAEIPGTCLKFRHMMIREIFEEPEVTSTFLSKGFKQVQEIAESVSTKKYVMIYVVGSGTSYHAGLAAQYAISTLTPCVTSLIPASEFSSWIPSGLKTKSLLIAVSQSGESSDVISAAKAASERGMDILAVTNTPHSTLMGMAEMTLLTRAGKESAVTATKSHIAQLLALFLLAEQLAELENNRAVDLKHLRRQLFKTPEIIQETIRSVDDRVQKLAAEYCRQNFFFLLGSGPNYSTALEGALKLKEACNIFAEGFAMREFLHGPVQLVDKRTSLFFILTEDQLQDTVREIESVRAFEASVLSIFDGDDQRLSEASNEVIRVPKGFPKVFSSIINIVPLQLFAYYSSVARGLNPDRPEKLTKVVK